MTSKTYNTFANQLEVQANKLKVQASPRKIYRLQVPRPQYDRIAEGFNLKESYFESYDLDTDTVTFKISEVQRLNFLKNYYISQVFLEENIGSYTV
jgi:hypothetical protein